MSSKRDSHKGRYPYGTTPSSKGIVHYHAWCEDCGWMVGSRNCIGLAAQHHGRTGHKVGCETGYSIQWDRKVG